MSVLVDGVRQNFVGYVNNNSPSTTAHDNMIKDTQTALSNFIIILQ